MEAILTGLRERVAQQEVRLDVIVLVLAMISFAAALLAYCEEVLSASEQLPSPRDIEDASPASAKSEQQEKAADIQDDGKNKVREDLPEPEPEGCDEDSRRKHLEVCLERLPGEAWGFAWHSKAFVEQRLIIVGIDADSPAGRWQLEREHQGLPRVERGDELVCANELAQHSSMQISLVVANKLRLKFLRAEGVSALAGGAEPALVGASEACKEEVLKESPPAAMPDAFAESDVDELDETASQSLLTYDGVPRNFWSYQRLPLRSNPPDTLRDDLQTAAPDLDAPCTEIVTRSVPRLRSRSDPPAAPRPREGSCSPTTRKQRLGKPPFARSQTGGPRSPASIRSARSAVARGLPRRQGADGERDSQLFSCGSGSENASRSDQCPSTDWEYMMDSRAQQCQLPDPSQGHAGVMMLLQPMLGGVMGQPPVGQPGHGPLMPAPPRSPHVSDASTTPPPPLTSPKVPNMPVNPGMPGTGLMVPMAMNHGFASTSMASTPNPQVLSWAPAWQTGRVAASTSSWMPSTHAPVDESMEQTSEATARAGKKTYRAGQRLTARRLRAAQRAAELSQALPSGPALASPRSEPSSASEEEVVPAPGPLPSEGRTKPRRRAGVRVRRRREHAIARRREQEQGEAPRPQPVGAVPPGPVAPLEEAHGFNSTTEMDPGSPVCSQRDTCTWLRSRPGDSGRAESAGQPSSAIPELESNVIGREVLINGLVHTPHLNGHWGRVADFDQVRNRYLVHAFVGGSSPLALRLRREAFVVPKTSPPGPDELVEGIWQPSLRM